MGRTRGISDSVPVVVGVGVVAICCSAAGWLLWMRFRWYGVVALGLVLCSAVLFLRGPMEDVLNTWRVRSALGREGRVNADAALRRDLADHYFGDGDGRGSGEDR